MQHFKEEENGFYLHLHGYESGPFTLSNLREMLDQNIITPSSLVWREGMPEWRQVGGFIVRTSSHSSQISEVPEPSEHYTSYRPDNSSTAGVSYTPFVLLGVAVIFIASYIASPFFAMYDLRRAVERGDAASLQERIDFPEIRQSFKDQVKAGFMERLAKDNKASTLSTGIATAFAPILIDNIVDSLVTPVGISNYIWNARFPTPAEDGKPLDEPAAPQKAEFRTLNISYAWFSGLTTFKIVSKDKDLVLRLHLKDFKWKLYSIEMPRP